MPTKIELTLEQSQQGVSDDVLVNIEGVEELKRNVWIKVIRLLDPKLKTLGERGIECIFVGNAEYSKAFRFSSVSRPSQTSLVKGTEDSCGSVVPKKVIEEDDPKTFDEAMKYQDVVFWKEAINDEMDSIMGNNTWLLTDLPSGIDYLDTYALVAHISTIRLLIAMASIHSLIIHQMDVKIAFLNGKLDEEVPNKFDESGKRVIICLYVDDMLIFGTDQVQIDLIKEFLSSSFFMKDMGEANVIHVSTPMDTSEKPDIAFTVSKLSRYTSNLGTQHWQAIQRVTDASWINNTEDNSFTSGWVFLLGGGVIYWASKKQTCITGSTMESKFVALAAAGKEAEWLKNLLLEIPMWSKPIAHIFIRCDSAATLAKAYSQMYNEKSRHLGVRHSMILELITNGVVSIEFVRSQQNIVDHLTKGLARDLIIKSAGGMGLKSN
ncbi:zinc finger, CCHC-type containing protein [Tanacetum coccineum]